MCFALLFFSIWLWTFRFWVFLKVPYIYFFCLLLVGKSEALNVVLNIHFHKTKITDPFTEISINCKLGWCHFSFIKHCCIRWYHIKRCQSLIGNVFMEKHLAGKKIINGTRLKATLYDLDSVLNISKITSVFSITNHMTIYKTKL